MRYEDPLKIIDILRLSEMGCSQREIAKSVKCAKSTVGEIQKRNRICNLNYESAVKMTNDEILNLLYPDSINRKPFKVDPDWQHIHTEITTFKRRNISFMWGDYRSTNPEGLGFSQFCQRYSEWKNETGKNVVMVQQRVPGKELFVDWMGDTLDCVTDIVTGQLYKAHFFVSVLGDSSYPYVEAFPNEKLENWLTAHVNAFEWIGGLPRVVVPDNCKTAVTKPNRYDPLLNPAYMDLACHYSVAVIPARVREPQDKASVESGVGWMETWLLEWLRGKKYFSFEALNADIRERVRVLSEKPFQKRAGSRKSVFEQIDRPALRTLPSQRFEHAQYVIRSVPDNYHVEFDGFYYSVPHILFRQKVTLRITSGTIEIINDNRERVSFHIRRVIGSRYVTIPEHMPPNHRHQSETNQYDGERYRSWARNNGENTHFVIDRMLSSQAIEEQAYRSCMGVLQCSKKYGNDRLEAACAKARMLNSCTYTTISNILRNGQDKITPIPTSRPTPIHKNLRGAATYK